MQVTRWLGLLTVLFLVTFISIEAKDKRTDFNQYRVTRNDYTFSTVFDMAAGNDPMGSVVKSMFHIATHYDSYDRFGLYQGRGICRLFCLGVFYTWGTEIDVYGENGQYEGMIDGQAVSSEPAKFSFYNDRGERVAIGYLDQNQMGFSLVDPNNSSLILARLIRNFIPGTLDNWDVAVYYPEQISPNFVKIFAAFVCDTQDSFKPDL